ncbi:MAG: aspartate aminotransferase family protein [Bryobacteraceae bacterium]
MSTASAVSPVDLEKQYLLQNYARYPVVLQRGKGVYVYDTSGKRYLDLISGIGVNSLGYAHPRMTKVIREQVGKIIHTSNLYHHEYTGPLAERMSKASGLERIFFCNSGTESVEAALKMAKAHGKRISPDKYELVSLDNSFHGRSLGALSITGQEAYRGPFEPLIPGAHFVPRNDITALEQAVSHRTAAIVLELIQGEGGIFPLTEEYIRKARELATRVDALLIFDEIQCGVGRTGTYFAYQLLDPVVLPDIMVTAKPMGCGIPLAVVGTTEKVSQIMGPGSHGTTFGGNPLACRVGLEFFEILDELLPQIANVGSYFRMKLTELQRKYSFIKEVRGIGLMIGTELEFSAKQVVLDCLEQGMLINVTHGTTLRALPPYILTEQDVDRAILILNRVFKKTKPPAEAPPAH